LIARGSLTSKLLDKGQFDVVFAVIYCSRLVTSVLYANGISVNRMAPIDWDQLMKLDVQELQDNAALTEDMYCVLSDVRIDLILQWNSDAIIFIASLAIHRA